MTNKPMFSVDLRALLERVVKGEPGSTWAALDDDRLGATEEMCALLDKSGDENAWRLVPSKRCPQCVGHGTYLDGVACGSCFGTGKPVTQHQGEPVAQSEFEPDAICLESDGCPTEGAVLKRFWRENQPDPVLCEFYEAEDFPSLVRELVGHVAQLQEAAKRNVKPWEDTFPPTLLPAYIARINAEQPAPVADHTQCEECKGWGYHENHHEGGGTECGECGGSGNASVELVMPERLNTEGGYSLEAEAWYNLALDDVAGLNGVTK